MLRRSGLHIVNRRPEREHNKVYPIPTHVVCLVPVPVPVPEFRMDVWLTDKYRMTFSQGSSPFPLPHACGAGKRKTLIQLRTEKYKRIGAYGVQCT